MSNKSWSREDVVQWLKECGCEEEKFSINDEGMYETSYDPETLYRQVSDMNGVDSAQCAQICKSFSRRVYCFSRNWYY